jgi:hypothetical protein
MNIRNILSMCIALVISTASLALAQNAALPAIQQSGDITYVTGGIDSDERSALESVRGDYNLHIMNSLPDGTLAGYTHITLSDNSGNQLLTADSGPIFYAKLAAGKYTLESENEGVQQKKQITISGKATNAHLVWK